MDCLVDEGLPTLVFALSLTLHGFPIAGSKLKITPLPLNAIGDPYGLAILCTGLDAVDSSIANGAIPVTRCAEPPPCQLCWSAASPST